MKEERICNQKGCNKKLFTINDIILHYALKHHEKLAELLTKPLQ